MSDLITDLFAAYFVARRNKRGTENALQFELNLESNILQLYDDIVNFRYEISPSICFIVQKPVKREIFAADFRDRIVHHFLIGRLMPIFENQFIYDSYSCRKKKGNLFGVKRLEHHLRVCSANFTQPAYILKLDIQGFFMNIQKPLLNEMVQQLIAKKYFGDDKPILHYLADLIIMHDPTQDCQIHGNPSDWDGLPANKSLFKTPADCGLPIGNLTSQIFGNYYLTPFDHFMKEKLKLKHYGRYVDDFFIVHTDREFLKSLIPKIAHHLSETVGATLHPKKIWLQHFEVGVPYLGAYIKPFRTYLSKRTKGNFYEAVRKQAHYFHEKMEQLHAHHLSNAAALSPSARLYPEDVQDLVATLNSYLGMANHFQMDKFVQKMLHLVHSEF